MLVATVQSPFGHELSWKWARHTSNLLCGGAQWNRPKAEQVGRGERPSHSQQPACRCQILAALAKHASEQREAFDPQSVISQLMELSVDPLFKKSLGDAAEFLQNRRSPAALARHLGWDYGVSGYIVPTTIMSAYCFLRYPGDFRRAVESAIVLGGDADSIGAIVGGLSGSLLGYSQIPAPLIERIGGGPHGPAWIKKMAERLSHWPHGVDDLHAAPALPAYPSMQLIRNTLTIPLVLCHVGLRLPFRMMTRRTPRRDRN